MDRLIEILPIGSELTAEARKRDIKRLQAEYQSRKKALHTDFLNVLDRLFEQGVLAEKKSGCLAISMLRSSLITRTYEYQIALYDQTFYADFNSIGCYWTPEFIYRQADAYIEEAAPKMKKKMIRLLDYEIEEYRQFSTGCYQGAARDFFQAAAQELHTLPMFQKSQKTWPFAVLYGIYMEEPMVLRKLEEGEA